MIKELKKEDFDREITLPALKATIPTINNYLKKLRPIINQILNCPKVQPLSQTHKLIVLKDGTTLEQINTLLPQEMHVIQDQLVPAQVKLSFQNFTTSEIFNFYYPDISSPNSYETIDHIAHYNLTPEQAEVGKLIGEILLLKSKLIKTVVNKTEKLHNLYRTPVLELLAGDKNFEGEVKEQGVRFKVDFEKVYWCSKLQNQRDRLLKKLNAGETLLDLFCGVGPLAVRAAKKGLFVVANDLNPDCYIYLQKNAKINHVEDRMMIFNACAREVARKWYDKQFVKTLEPQFQKFQHVYMNLPVDAIEFLDVFQDFQMKTGYRTQELPLIHVNGFVVAITEEQSKTKMTDRIRKILPNFTQDRIQDFAYIKHVTNVMRMYCITLRLPPDASEPNFEDYEPNKKKHKPI